MERTLTTCSVCGAEIEARAATVLPPRKRNDPPIALCPACVAQVEALFVAETEGAQLLPAVGLGLVAGLAAAAVWYAVVIVTDYQLGLVAVGVGWLVAQAVMLGAGRKRGGALPWISTVLTLIAMTVAQYLIMRNLVVGLLAEEGVSHVDLLLPLDLAAILVFEGLKADPVTLFFWIIALWQAYSMTRKRRLPKA